MVCVLAMRNYRHELCLRHESAACKNWRMLWYFSWSQSPVLLYSRYIVSIRTYPVRSTYRRSKHSIMGRPCTCSHILILTITELLVDNASVPAGGPFIVLLPAGGPFIFSALVDDASVTAGGPFIFCSTLTLWDVTADVSLQVCHS